MIDIKGEPIDFRNKNFIIAADLDNVGFNLEIMSFISNVYRKDINVFENSNAILLVNSPSEYYTKSFSQDIILRMNIIS